MNKIKQFESFKGKEVGAINKFLKSIDKEASGKLIKFLSSISTYIDRPLSEIQGEYLTAKKAMGMNRSSSGNGYLKIFFSLKDGITASTKSSNNTRFMDHLDTYLNSRGFVSDDQIERLSSRINGKLVPVKNYTELKNDDFVIVKFQSTSIIRDGFVYREKMDDGKENIFVMSTFDTGSIPYMISPNEADKKLVKFQRAFYSIVFRNDSKTSNHGYLGKIEEDDKPLYQVFDSSTESMTNFIKNNIPTGSELSNKSWDSNYVKLINESDFALVIDIDKIIEEGTSLKDAKSKRGDTKKGILPRIDDEYFKRINKDRYSKKLNKSDSKIDFDDERDFILKSMSFYIKRMSVMDNRYPSSYSSDNYGNRFGRFGDMDMLRDLLDYYSRKSIGTREFLDILDENDPRAYDFLMYELSRYDRDKRISWS